MTTDNKYNTPLYLSHHQINVLAHALLTFQNHMHQAINEQLPSVKDDDTRERFKAEWQREIDTAADLEEQLDDIIEEQYDGR